MKRMSKWVLAAALLAMLAPGLVWAGNVSLNRNFDQVVVKDYAANGAMISLNLDEPAEGAAPAPAPAPALAPADKKEPAAPAEKKREHREHKAKANPEWGGFGGPIVQHLWIDLSVLDPMTNDRGLTPFNNNLVLVGGVGGVIHKNFRFGGFGFGGSQERADRVLGHRRSAEVSLGGGGLFMEYNQNLNPNAGVDLGLLVGAGSMDLSVTGPVTELGPDGKWSANGSFGLGYPYVGLWYAPTKWMWLQLDGGYLWFNLDSSRDSLRNDMGVRMLSGDVNGGWGASLKINFGFNPNK